MDITQFILGGLGVVALALAVISFRKRKAPDPAGFTRDYIARLKKANPEVQVRAVGDLELEIFLPGSDEPLRAFLDNAFRDYTMSPRDKQPILDRYVGALTESRATATAPIDPTRILPVIRDCEFLEQAGKVPGKADKPVEIASEQFNDDLYVMYVADSEHSVRYLSEADLEEAKVDRAGLRAQAVENLRRLYPEVQVMGANGLFMVRLDGTYESSLLLSERLWEQPMEVKGEIIAAVPTRDLLLITGTLEREGLEMMRKIVAEASANASYRISSKMFIRRNGQFEAWE